MTENRAGGSKTGPAVYYYQKSSKTSLALSVFISACVYTFSLQSLSVKPVKQTFTQNLYPSLDLTGPALQPPVSRALCWEWLQDEREEDTSGGPSEE